MITNSFTGRVVCTWDSDGNLYATTDGLTPYEKALITRVLRYKGRKFNGNDVQDGLWESYQETLDNINNCAEWEDFVINNAVDYLEDIIAYGFGS